VPLFSRHSVPEDELLPSSSAARGWDRQVQHGTLRSELDEPAVLLPAFSELAARVAELMASYDAGHLTRSALAGELDTAKVTHTDGSVWTIGVSSGQWYRRLSGVGTWEAALPPDGATTTVDNDLTADGPAWLQDTPRIAPAPAPDTISGFGSPAAPWPDLHAGASGEPLPENRTDDGYLIDDDGVWESNWEAAARPTTPARPQPPLDALDELDDDDLGLPPEFFNPR
jgi:hypothetical protein